MSWRSSHANKIKLRYRKNSSSDRNRELQAETSYEACQHGIRNCAEPVQPEATYHNGPDPNASVYMHTGTYIRIDICFYLMYVYIYIYI